MCIEVPGLWLPKNLNPIVLGIHSYQLEISSEQRLKREDFKHSMDLDKLFASKSLFALLRPLLHCQMFL